MAQLVSSVPFKELLNRRVERGKWFGPAQFERSYLMAWPDRWQFLRDVLGTAETTGDPPTPVRTPPQRYPDEGIGGIYAVDFRVVGKGKASLDGGVGVWEKAEVTIGFGTPNYDLGSGGAITYRTESLDMAAQVVPMPASIYKFTDDNKPIQHDVMRLIGSTEMVLSTTRVPFLPVEMIESMVGHVNQYEFMGRPAEHLLFLGANTSRETTSGEIPVWAVQYRFLYRSENHQKLPRPDTGLFVRVTPDIYPKADFSLLP